MDIIGNIETLEERTYILKEYFTRYLLYSRKVKQSTVAHYLDALNNISNRLKNDGLIDISIYEINNIDRIKEIREYLFSNESFVEQNKKGNQMYSAGINNYIRFVSGEWIGTEEFDYEKYDHPFLAAGTKTTVSNTYSRSTIIKDQVIYLANNRCEIQIDHESFIAERTNKPYMEGHHLIPMNTQKYFSNSLDIYANIICLCPICHRKIHYGLKNERLFLIDELYEKRQARLSKSGIDVSRKDLEKLILK